VRAHWGWAIIVLLLAAVVAALLTRSLREGDGEADGNAGRDGGEGATLAVAHVGDGDSFRLANGAEVRLVQIDAPELGEHECYAPSARAELRRLLRGPVRLEFDPALDRVDRFGRQLAYVFVGRTNVNLELVRRGAASVWFVGGRRGIYANELLQAARRSRDAGRGLWSACPGTRLDPSAGVVTRS
jgi:micrococcal nuclease